MAMALVLAMAQAHTVHHLQHLQRQLHRLLLSKQVRS